MKCLLLILAFLVANVHAGAYFPFNPSDWAFGQNTPSSNFKMQLYYNGPSLSTATTTVEYGNLPKARTLVVSNNSFPYSPSAPKPTIVYVSTKGAVSQGIYALVDLRSRGVVDYAFLIAKDLVKAPLGNGGSQGFAINGLGFVSSTTFTGGQLYILASEYFVANRLLRIDDIDKWALNKTTVPASSIAIVRDDFPHDSWHGWRYMRFDKNKNLYVGFGANCNACNVYGTGVDNGSMYNRAYDSNMTNVHNSFQKAPGTGIFQFASIYKITPPYTAVAQSGTGTKATGLVKIASGVRNTVGFDFHPTTGQLFFTDNGRDDIGNYLNPTNPLDPAVITETRNKPDCELNWHSLGTNVGTNASNYGFPYCHTSSAGGSDYHPFVRDKGIGTNVVDPDLNPNESKMSCNSATVNYTKAIQAFGPHTAPLGMRFYKALSQADKQNFPAEYNNDMFVALHGSWNRDFAIGARVTRVKVSTTSPPSVTIHAPFLSGGVPGDVGLPDGPLDPIAGSKDKTIQNWRGRPVDVEYLPDSTILVSDDEMGAVYRITSCGSPTVTSSYPAWGGNARYGVARCGGFVHPVTADKIGVRPVSNANLPNLANGCTVNFGTETQSYTRCAEYDATARGTVVNVAYNLRRSPDNTKLIMDGAYVAHDYKEVNANGWTTFSIPSSGIGNAMTNALALIAQPINDYKQGAVTVYKLGAGSAGVAGFSTNVTNFIANGTQPTAYMAGNALVSRFQIYLPNTQSAVGFNGNLSSMISFGDVDAKGAIKQHWVITLTNLTISAADVGATPGSNLPVVNPNIAPPPTYEPACVASDVSPVACDVGMPGCLNGDTYNTVTTVSDWSPLKLSFYFKQPSNGMLSMGLKADVSGYGNGWAAMTIPTSNNMGGNDGIFLRKLNSNNAQAVNYVLDGWQGYQPVKPYTCKFNNIKNVAAAGSNGLISTFDIPFTGPTKIRYGAGAYTGSAGIDGMDKHPSGKYPYFACVFQDNNGDVQITSVPSATYTTGWTGTPCA